MIVIVVKYVVIGLNMIGNIRIQRRVAGNVMTMIVMHQNVVIIHQYQSYNTYNGNSLSLNFSVDCSINVVIMYLIYI